MVRTVVQVAPGLNVVFTECWKSCSQVFALSNDDLSGARLKTSSADKTAWMLSVAAIVADVRGGRMVVENRDKDAKLRKRSQGLRLILYSAQSRLFVDVDD